MYCAQISVGFRQAELDYYILRLGQPAPVFEKTSWRRKSFPQAPFRRLDPLESGSACSIAC